MRTVALNRPAPGQHIRLPLAETALLAFSFNPVDVVFRRRHTALVLSFRDGATIELADFFVNEGIPSRTAVLADGTRMEVVELLTLFAPHLLVPPGASLSEFTSSAFSSPKYFPPASPGNGAELPHHHPVMDLSAFAEEEEFLLSPERLQADDTARHNLVPVYQEIIFRDGDIIIGPSIYGTFFPLGAESALHLHLDNSEAEMLDLDDLIARLPGLFPDQSPIRIVAVTGGLENSVIMEGERLSDVLETVPLEGLGTTQFDSYAYRTGSGAVVAVYVETLLHLLR